jgi:hypothetical protein
MKSGIATSGQVKAVHYDWAKPGDSGRRCIIPVAELKIDQTYQRQEVSEGNTLAIARAFNWLAFNSIVVMERANGDKYVVDGQQRLTAAIRRGDIKAVPCSVFKSDGPEHEAGAFVSLNVSRKPVSAIAKFNASAMAGINPQKQISDWLSSLGMRVINDGKDVNGVSFPTALVSTWEYDAESAKTAILVQRDVIGPEYPVNGVFHKGAWWLLHNGIDVEEHADKLKRLGGLAAVLRSVKTVEIETGANASNRVCGLGMLRLINYKRRGQKIAAPEGA